MNFDKFNPFHVYKDRNGKKLKENDVVVMHNDRLAGPNTRLLVRYSYEPHVNIFRRTPVIYNPNCCIVCRKKKALLWDMADLVADEIEVIGNLTKSPELLPLIPVEDL